LTIFACEVLAISKFEVIIMQGTDADECELTNNDFVHDIEWLLREKLARFDLAAWILGLDFVLYRLYRLRLHGLPAAWGM
jgi:hypothetical protein